MNFKSFFEGKPDDPTDLEVLGPRVTKKLAAAAEAKLGYALPAAYVKLLEVRNGGYLAKKRFPTRKVPSWAPERANESCRMMASASVAFRSPDAAISSSRGRRAAT